MLSKWRGKTKLEYLAPLLILAACVVWLATPPAHFDQLPTGHDRVVEVGDEQPPPPPPHRGRHGEHRRHGHHGPPPGVPPTVLFLVGAGLGYLIGRSRRFGPPPHHRHHHHSCNKPNPEE